MPDYHRTQVQLEKRQVLRLRELAAHEGVSMSELLRRIVDRELRARDPPERDLERLREITAFLDDPDFDAREHDRVLYGDAR